MPTTRLEDEPKTLIYVDILGFRYLTNKYRVRVEDYVENYKNREYVGSRTTEIQRQINCFNRILDSSVSEMAPYGGTQAMLFSDCAYLVFSKSVPNEYPAVRVRLVATDLMRKFINNRVPVRMGIGKGTFYDIEYLTTTNGKLITSKSRFMGTAVICAHDAEQCGGKGLRIFVDESSEEDLSHMGRRLQLPQPLKSVKWELDYLHDSRPIGQLKQLEKDDRELFDNVASMNAPELTEGARLHYTETLAALNRMRVSNNRKAFPVPRIQPAQEKKSNG